MNAGTHFLYQADRYVALQGPYRRYLPVVLLALLGLILTTLAVRQTEQRETARIRAEFRQHAVVFAAAFQGSLEGHLQALPTIEALVPVFAGASADQAGSTTQMALQPFLQLSRQRYPGLEGFAWVVEQPAEFTPDLYATSSGRHTRYRVMLAEPATGQDAVIGSDLGADPIRREAIERAIATRKISVSGRTTLITGDGFRDGVLMILPLSLGTGGDSGTDAGGKQPPIAGLLVASLRFDRLLRATLGDLGHTKTRITLWDEDTGGLTSPMMAAWGDPAVADSPTSWAWNTQFPVADRQWRLTLQPTAAYVAGGRSMTAWIVLGTGLALTALLCSYLATVIQRSGRISRLASAREREIEQRVQAEAALRASEERFRALVQHSSDMVLVLNAFGELSYVSPAITRVLGQDADALVGAELLLLVHPTDRGTVRQTLARLHTAVEAPFAIEWRMRHIDSGWRWLEATVSNLLNERSVQGIVLNIRDITERKRLETQLTRQAFNDSLTSLPNRALFLDRLAQALTGARRTLTGLAVLYVDLDGFKVVNDSLGHGAGDQLLVEVGRRLADAVRPGDTVARLGGDEFAVLLPGTSERSDAVRVAERILAALRAPVLLGKREIVISCSVGVALQQPDAAERDLLREADIALYQAKEAGKARLAMFDPSMERQVARRLDLELDLRRALERNEFRVYYQPAVEPATGMIVGMEALVRWQHPERGLIAPAEFISLAEETGLIVPLGLWVLREACLDAREWRRLSNREGLELSVNLSARQLSHPELPAQVARVLAESGLPPSSLHLELTESTLMDDGPGTLATLKTLTDLGVRLAIDDFGTGYASLTYLQRFPISTLKIDRSFVSVADHDPRARAIIQTVTDLAHALGVTVTAEGIETHEHLSCVTAAGCDHGQGFFFSPPVPGVEMEALLASGLPLSTPPSAVA